jgi:hypothetical protein
MSSRISFHRLDLRLRLIVAAGPTVVLTVTAFHLNAVGGVIAFAGCATLLAVIVSHAGVAITRVDKRIRIGFIPFWFVTLSFAGIDHVSAEEVRPFEDFGGWGIKGRSRKKGLLFSSGGSSAVAFSMLDGRRYFASVTPGTAAAIAVKINAAVASARE